MNTTMKSLSSTRARALSLAAVAAVGTTFALVPAVANSAATVGFSVVDTSLTEGDPTTTTNYVDYPVKITRTGTTTAAAAVKVSTLDGTATAGTATDGGDYRTVSTPVVVTFAAGATSAVTSVRIYRDTVMEANESFFVVLSAPSGAAILDGVGQVTLLNDDETPVRSGFAIGDAIASEATGTVNVPVFRYGPSTTSASVQVATANGTAFGCSGSGTPLPGCDYTALTGKLVPFAAGQTVALVPVTLVSDQVAEVDETFSATLSGATGATIDPRGATGTVTIVSATSPPAGVKISDAVVAEGNSGTTTMTFTVTRVGPADTSAFFQVSTAVGTATATDFTALKGVGVSFAADEVTKTVTVSVIGDTTVESNESFTVKLSSPDGTPILDGTGTGTIVNDD